MGYSIRTLNYLERIILFNLTYKINVTDLVPIDMEALRIDSECSLEKNFNELIHMNPYIVLYLNVNQVYLYQDSVCGLLT